MTSDNNEERVETTEQSIPVSGVEVPETNDDAVAEETEAAATSQQEAAKTAAPEPGRGHGPKNPMSTLGALLKMVISYYPGFVAIIIVCILASAILSSLPSVFMQKAIDIIGQYWESGDWASAGGPIAPVVLNLAIV